MKKHLFLLISILFCSISLPTKSFADTYYYSDSIYVYNLDDKEVEFAVNPDLKRSPASLTKIMTTILALEKSEDLSETATISPETFQYAIDSNAAMSGIPANVPVTIKDLLYGTMLPSAAECANTLAMHISGTETAFVEEMNEKAHALGMDDTKFQTTEGLDAENQYTTARDMARLVEYSIQNEDFYKIFTSSQYTTQPTETYPNGITMYSTVLPKLSEYIIESGEILGGKSGTTLNAGLCWATLAEKDGKQYIIIVMGSSLDSGNGQVLDTVTLLNQL